MFLYHQEEKHTKLVYPSPAQKSEELYNNFSSFALSQNCLLTLFDGLLVWISFQVEIQIA